MQKKDSETNQGNSRTTLVILLDAFRSDYLHPKDTPFLWKLKDDSVYIKKLLNPGRYCERSVFMTGAGPEVTGNYFAMSLKPVGYKRAEYEPTFNIPMELRSHLAMTEDTTPDFEPNSFGVESIWDVMRKENKTWAIEACIALGIQSYRGKTTHGNRPIQLIKQIPAGHDLYYIQYSETDQILHEMGTSRKNRKGLLRNIDGNVGWLVREFKKHFNELNIIVFGDHGMDDIKEYVDLSLEYPPFTFGWDYLYLKSTAAIQFWIFNPRIEKYIKNDPLLRKHGDFINSPSIAQGDLIWMANYGTALSPCHFHSKGHAPRAMHGWDENHDNMKGMAIVHNGKTKKVIEEGDLKDICSSICKLVRIREPEKCEGVSYV